MKKIISFLRWEFKGCTRSPSFWGAMIVILGLVMFLFDCPKPWPFAAIVVGFVMNFVDMIYCWIRFRVAMYKMDQESVARKLQKD
jgi:formate-dependent nitrite reductase membrane component NrfD